MPLKLRHDHGEPVISLPASDPHALALIEHYRNLCIHGRSGADLAEIEQARQEIEQWRLQQPDLSEMPA